MENQKIISFESCKRRAEARRLSSQYGSEHTKLFASIWDANPQIMQEFLLTPEGSGEKVSPRIPKKRYELVARYCELSQNAQIAFMEYVLQTIGYELALHKQA